MISEKYCDERKGLERTISPAELVVNPADEILDRCRNAARV